jgi:hypothetical protein
VASAIETLAATAARLSVSAPTTAAVMGLFVILLVTLYQ